MPPKNSTPTAAHGSGDDQAPGPDSGEAGIPSGEVAGCGAAGCKGELPDDRLGRTTDVVGVRAGTVAVAGGVAVAGAGVAVGDAGKGVGVGRGGVAVGEGTTSVGVSAGGVGVSGRGVGVGGSEVGVTGETGDWNQAPSAGPPSRAKISLARRTSSTICTMDFRFDTVDLDRRSGWIVQTRLCMRKADNSNPRISLALRTIAERFDEGIAP
jgi:hypothetical protein